MKVSMQKRTNSKYLVGDSRNIERLLSRDGPAEAIITSPPYFQVLDYGVKKQIGKGSKDYSSFLKEIQTVLRQCYKCSSDSASLWLICDSFRLNGNLVDLPSDFRGVAIAAGWVLRDIIIWNKVKTRPQSAPGGFRNNIEQILVFLKSPSKFKLRTHRENSVHGKKADYIWKWPERYSPLGLNPGKLWTAPIMNQGTWSASHENRTRIHFCPFPQELVARIINISTDPGDVVLDPFAGAGTVPAQAELMGRLGIGVEINPEFRQFYSEIKELFRLKWEKDSPVRQMVHDDRIREAILISRMRALKAVSSMFGASIEATRLIKKVCLIEPVTAAEEVERALSSRTNSADLRLCYKLYILCEQMGAEDAKQLASEFERSASNCGISGKIEMIVDQAEWMKSIPLLSGRWWVYDGARQMRPVGGIDSLQGVNATNANYPVLANFDAPAYGSKSAPLETAIAQFKQEYIKQVALNVGKDENQIADLLGTSRLEIHKFLSMASNDLRKATRTQEQSMHSAASELEG